MPIEALIVWLVIGAIAGWLAGLIVEGYGFGLMGNIAVGSACTGAGWLAMHDGRTAAACSVDDTAATGGVLRSAFSCGGVRSSISLRLRCDGGLARGSTRGIPDRSGILPYSATRRPAAGVRLQLP